MNFKADADEILYTSPPEGENNFKVQGIFDLKANESPIFALSLNHFILFSTIGEKDS